MIVGLVGCGPWGRHVLRDLRTVGCGVHVAAHSDASIARATEGGAAAVVLDVGALKGVAGIAVATPSTHAELRAFVSHLEGGPPPRSSAAEGGLVVEHIVRLRALAGAT